MHHIPNLIRYPIFHSSYHKASHPYLISFMPYIMYIT
jgi:hypothetical protein